jgi:hypothetical protein
MIQSAIKGQDWTPLFRGVRISIEGRELDPSLLTGFGQQTAQEIYFT